MDIKDLIPQRAPFLFIKNFEIKDDQTIETQFEFKQDEYFFQGHFPENPIVPGVILSEHCFQSGAALIASQSKDGIGENLAVVSRIQNAKFKQIVKPNEKITTITVITEQIDNAAYFKSTVKNQENKKVLIIEFACTLVQDS